MKIRLRVAISAPNERVREFDLEFSGPQIWIGRDRESDIHIPLSEVSRKHARIVSDESTWFVEDMDSAALTYAEVKAIASGNPMVIEKAQVDAELIRLTTLIIPLFSPRSRRWRQSRAYGPRVVGRPKACASGGKRPAKTRKTRVSPTQKNEWKCNQNPSLNNPA